MLLVTIVRVTRGLRRPVAIIYRLAVTILIYVPMLVIFLRKGATPRAFLIVLPLLLIMTVLAHKGYRYLSQVQAKRLPRE